MKVLHLLNSNKYSGAENVVCQIISMFKDTDIEMIYCSPNGSISELLNKLGIKYVPLNKLSIFEVKKVLKKVKPDLIHAHDFRASVIAACLDVPVVSHLHNNSLWLKKYCFQSYLYGITCLKYHRVLTVSDSIFNEFVFGNRFKSKLDVVGNPVNIKEIISKSNEYVHEKKYDVIFLGRLSAAKNPLFFLDIIYELVKIKDDINVIMVGDGELRDEVEKKIKQLNLKKYINLLGFVSNPYPIVKQSKVMCMPSVWEGFGLAAVEALALGIPVVCSGVGGLKGIVDNSCGCICSEINEYVKEISDILNDDDYIKKMSKGALYKSNKFDNYMIYKEKMYMLYNSMRANQKYTINNR